MTAEVAVLNRHAVALAADSAVTVHGQKVFNTANKIFALSKREPVALMVYGNGDLLRVPWEVLAKLYREHLGPSAPETLDGYVDGLLEFLRGLVGSGLVFGEEDQEHHLSFGVGVVLAHIRDQIDHAVDRWLAERPLASDDVRGLVAHEVEQFHRASRQARRCTSIAETTEARLLSTYGPAVEQVVAATFEQLPVHEAVARQLVEIGLSVFTRAWLRPLPFISGVVVAGYGAHDVFPRLRELEVSGILGGHLLYDRRREVTIGTREIAQIVPFAQQEMVYRFMEGIDPDYREFIEADFAELWVTALTAVLREITELTDEQKAHYAGVVADVAGTELGGYLTRLREYGKARFADPVMDIVASLPKGELADLAESLVNLTSLRLRLSRETETVGGPVDVAVISRGDGLVWIKRKHYFEGELNPQFLARYTQGDHDGSTQR